jgi:hypothetical protein
VYDSYTEGFFMTYMYIYTCMYIIYVSYPKLVQNFHYSPCYPIPLLNMTSTDFNVPYSHLYAKYVSHFHSPLASSFTFPFYFMKQFKKGWYQFFFKGLIEFSREPIRFWTFLFGDTLDLLQFNFVL